MARQIGTVKVEGTLGDYCFYKTQDGYLVRRKSCIPKERFKKDPAFESMRKNMAEFGRAGKAVRLIRTVFWAFINSAADKGASSRLTSTLLKVIKADDFNPRGERTVNDGQPGLLEGFEFNSECMLSNTLRAAFEPSIDRGSGVMMVRVPAFSPSRMIAAPQGATHFRLFSAGAAIDFSTETYELARAETAFLPIGRKKTPEIQLSQKVRRPAPGVSILVFGIKFMKVQDGMEVPFSSAGNALAVVKVAADDQN